MSDWKSEFEQLVKKHQGKPIWTTNSFLKDDLKTFFSAKLEELIDDIPDEVEFLHGVPVSMPKKIKQQLKDKWLGINKPQEKGE